MKPSDPDLAQALDELQKTYCFELDFPLIPETCRDQLYNAATRLAKQEIDTAKMGYSEEIGDVVYQLMKYVGVKEKILTRENQGCLLDVFPQGASGKKVIHNLYSLAYEKMNQSQVEALAVFFYSEFFPQAERMTKDFLANQYVSFLSRRSSGIKDSEGKDNDGFHTAEFILNDRLSEEVNELAEVMLFQNKPACTKKSLVELEINLDESRQLVKQVKEVSSGHYHAPLHYLSRLLHSRVNSTLTLQDVLDFTLFKIRCRQELHFKSVPRKKNILTAKVIDYFLQADMVFNGTKYSLK